MINFDEVGIPDNPIHDKRGYFYPTEIFESTDLTYGEKHILTLIYNLDHPQYHCFASNKYLAKKMNCSVKKIERLLARLYKKDWLIRKQEGRRRILIYKPNTII